MSPILGEDPRQAAMPAGAGARLDHARHTLQSLRREQERFARLGFEDPQARIHEQIRYWEFVHGLLSLTHLTPGVSR